MIFRLVLVLWMCGCSAVKTHHKVLERRAIRAGFIKSTLTAGPHSVNHWVGGEGPTVVLIHGFGGDGLVTWWPQARLLAKTHRVIVPDLLWFGGSDSDATPGLEAQVEAVGALVEHHVPTGELVDVVGISYGGFVALRYGTIAPLRQGRLVIMDSPGPLFSAADQAAMLERFGVEQPQDIFVPDDPDDIRVLIQLAYHKAPPLPRPLLKDMQRHVFSQHRVEQVQLLDDIEAGRERYAGLAPAEYSESLVIWGEHDRVFPVAIGRQLSELLGAEFVVIEGAAHAPHIERPRQVNAMLVDFLRGESTGG